MLILIGVDRDDPIVKRFAFLWPKGCLLTEDNCLLVAREASLTIEFLAHGFLSPEDYRYYQAISMPSRSLLFELAHQLREICKSRTKQVWSLYRQTSSQQERHTIDHARSLYTGFSDQSWKLLDSSLEQAQELYYKTCAYAFVETIKRRDKREKSLTS